ncbi:MAG: LysM peptidoglycan-binding domain-containing protein [Cyanobium sp.]
MRRSLVALALAVTLPLPSLAGQVTVKEGETLSEIAEQHGISLTRLMQINGITNADRVEAGRALTVPGSGGGSGATGGTVTVRPGETLSQIAERHGLPLSQLMQINGIHNADQVEAGQTLRLRAAPQPAPRTASATAPGAPSYPRGAREHVVRPGESLSVIADGYGIGMSKLIAINGIGDPNHVEAGTRLKLKGQPPAAPVATPRPAVTTATGSAAHQPTRTPQPTRPAPAAATPAQPTPTVATRPAPGGSRPAATTAATPTPRPTAPRPAAATTAAVPSAVATASPPDWRSYGPLQVNWAAWQPMGGSMVAPSLNGQGQSLYLAINCGARKINATTASGEWQSWDDPKTDFEQQLVGDYCRARG